MGASGALAAEQMSFKLLRKCLGGQCRIKYILKYLKYRYKYLLEKYLKYFLKSKYRKCI